MVVLSTMRRVWIAVTLSVAILSFYPAWVGSISWWMPGIAFTLFAVFLLEPYVLTWQIRRSGDTLQITDDGVLRRLGRGGTEQVRWADLREVAIIAQPGPDLSLQYFYALAGTGRSGVLVSEALASQHDLVSHLSKLPGFDHRYINNAASLAGNQKAVIWQARPFEGEATVIPMNRVVSEQPPRTLH
jgi:hypothetical protein